MSELYMGVLKTKEVKLLIAKADRGIREILIIGIYTGADLGEVLNLSPDQIKANTIALPNRTLLIPSQVCESLQAYIKWRRFKGLSGLWDLKELAQAGEAYQTASTKIINKPISWKAIRRTFVWHGSGAGYPVELIENNTGTNYKYIKEWMQNGKDYKKLVNEALLYQ